MEILVANHSSYPPAFKPRPASGSEADASEIMRHVVREQENAGVDVVTDGQISWADPMFHCLRHVDGVRFGEPQAFLDAGFTFRPAIIDAKVRPCAGSMRQEYQRTSHSSQRPVKPVLMGPYTLARCSQIATPAYRGMPELAADLSLLLAREVADLASAGARWIQVDEPLILRYPEDIRLVRDLLEPLKLAAGDTCQLIVSTYGADAERLYAQLNSLPADLVALDFADAPHLAEVVGQTGSGKILALGVTNGRSTGMEDPLFLTRQVERILHRYIHDVVYLQPSCGLASLPASVARAKLTLLGSVRDALLAT